MIKSKKSLVLGVLAASVGVTLFISAPVSAQNAKIGNLQIENAYTRATVPGQQVGTGYMKIDNRGIADQLIAVSSPTAGEVQLHEMSMAGDVMKMRQVKDIPIPAGGSVELKPGGMHLMFMNLRGPFTAGEWIPVKLTFAKAGEIELKMPVNGLGASGNGGGMHGGMMQH
jgi:copper(I)-binding protein